MENRRFWPVLLKYGCNLETDIPATSQKGAMKVNTQVTKDGVELYAGSYDVSDAESFGAAFSDAWSKLRQEQFDRETSIGALMEHLDGDVLELLCGAQVRLERE